MKTMINLLLGVVIATVLVTLANMVVGGAVFALFGNPWQDVPEAGDVFWPMVASSALLVVALVAPVRASVLPRWQRVAAVFVACLGVNVLLMQVEAAAFLDMNAMQLAAALTHATLVAACLSVVAGVLFGQQAGQPRQASVGEPQSWRLLLKRLAGCAVAYLFLYFIAGMAIYAKVADYYAAQGFEAGPWIVPLALLRGAFYVVFSLWLIRSMRCSRVYCALAIAVMFPLLAGVAALVVPSGFMPPDVRFWHAIEVGLSNFVFGALVGWLFWRRPGMQTVDATAPGPVHAT